MMDISNASWSSYPKVYNIGHKQVFGILNETVLIEEKVDGSQFSFGVFNGKLRCKSHHVELDIENPNKMFELAVEQVKSIKDKLHDGWTYRAEYLKSPKHNTLCYDRVPGKNLIIFDINHCLEGYLARAAKEAECTRIGLEVVPGKNIFIDNMGDFKKLLATTSVLGGSNIEGVVMKDYTKFTNGKKVMMAKYVSEKFKEIHRANYKQGNPSQSDITERIGEKYKTVARWEKAVQHLKEKSVLEDSPRDIGALIREVQNDIKTECEEEIKDMLFKWAWKRIYRRFTSGLPEWYKEKLVEKNLIIKD